MQNFEEMWFDNPGGNIYGGAGYIDFDTTRIQWSSVTDSGSDGFVNYHLHVPFSGYYSVVMTPMDLVNPNEGWVGVSHKNNLNFSGNRQDTLSGSVVWSWIAIGTKPPD